MSMFFQPFPSNSTGRNLFLLTTTATLSPSSPALENHRKFEYEKDFAMHLEVQADTPRLLLNLLRANDISLGKNLYAKKRVVDSGPYVSTAFSFSEAVYPCGSGLCLGPGIWT